MRKTGASGRGTALATMLAALLLAGCVPESVNPLGEPVAPDPRLAGRWEGTVGGDPAALAIAIAPGGDLEITLETTDAGGATKRAVMTGTPGSRDGYAYMNVKLRRAGDEIRDPARENYYICRYEIAGDGSLNVWTMSEKLAVAAIAEAGVNGLVDPGRDGEPTIMITDSTLALSDFVDAYLPERVFADRLGTFRRAE